MAKYSFDVLESIPSGFLKKLKTIIGASKKGISKTAVEQVLKKGWLFFLERK